MKRLLWIAMLLYPFSAVSGQDTAFKIMDEVFVKSIPHPRGPVKVTERKGAYSDPQTGRPLGNFRMIFAVDTVRSQLLNIVTIEKAKKAKEHVTIYYFNNGQLAQVATATRKNNVTSVDNLFTYTAEENAIDARGLEVLRENSEKYDLLRTARQYVMAYQKEKKSP